MLQGLAAERAAQQIVDYIHDWLRYDGLRDPGGTRVRCRPVDFERTDWAFTVIQCDEVVATLPLGEYLGRPDTAAALLPAVRAIRDDRNKREGLRWPPK